MKTRSWIIAAFLIVLGIMAAACGNDGQPEAGSTLQVTFDGTDCTYSGPEEVSESNIGFRVVNQSEAVLTLEVFRLQESKTFDDLDEHIKGGAGSAEPPPWVRSVGSVPTPSDKTSTFGMALSAGNYALVCTTGAPSLRAQAVASFTVVV